VVKGLFGLVAACNLVARVRVGVISLCGFLGLKLGEEFGRNSRKEGRVRERGNPLLIQQDTLGSQLHNGMFNA